MLIFQNAYTVQADEVTLADILTNEPYIKVELGGGYIGKCIMFDQKAERTLIQPNDGENKTIIRNKKQATVFYGKYRGKDEYKNYKKQFPELEAEFFLLPIKKLGMTERQIQENDYQIVVTEENELERFLVPLSYIGAIDNEIFTIQSVEILFDETCRPMEVHFSLQSESVGMDRIWYQESQMSQKYTYITEEEFAEPFTEIERKIQEIVPMEDVEVIDYIDELSNVVKMVDEHFLVVLRGEAKELKEKSGWDKAAVFAYLEAVDRRFSQFSHGYEGTQMTQEEYSELLDRVYQTAHLIGSNVYTYMFESSHLSAKKKTMLVLNQMKCYIDSNGMLQVGNGDSFDIEMAPHAEFLEDYAECVRLSYQKKNKKYKRLDNEMIHQFRMYIDKHNIEYVRNNYEGLTDYEKLKNYADAFEFELYYGEPSRHHNKIGGKEKFKEQEYDKILTPNHLSEFIINVKTGEFVTEWDVLEVDAAKGVVSSAKAYKIRTEQIEKKLVDTESFNYAPAEYVEAHQMLDVLPATPTSGKDEALYLENMLKKTMKKIWKSPGKIVYKEKYRKPKDYLK